MKIDSEISYQSAEEIETLQLVTVRKLLYYLEEYSPFYKRHFEQHAVTISQVHTLDDLQLIPPTTKDDLQRANWDFLCVDRKHLAEYTATSGTLGKPVTIALTSNDIERLAYNEALSFSCAGGSESDLFQLMLTLDRQFMAGIAYYEGIRKLGAGLIRVGPATPAVQWEHIMNLAPTALVSVPSFIVKLIEHAKATGADLNKTSVKRIICIGESIRNQDLTLNLIGKTIQDAWNVSLHSTYASTEMQTAFTECEFGAGGHLNPELLFVELLDENNNRVAAGEPGEVTITTLGVEAMPLLRFKTGDIARAYPETCRCGRTTTRLGPIEGRKQQMIKLKGTTVYPEGIFEVLRKHKEVEDFIVEASHNELGSDEIKIFLVASKDSEALLSTVRHSFQSALRVMPSIEFLTKDQLEIMLTDGGHSRKAKRFIDRRR